MQISDIRLNFLAYIKKLNPATPKGNEELGCLT